ncbi:MAG: hypothetical protein ACM3JD_02075 [Rudaea sp.]
MSGLRNTPLPPMPTVVYGIAMRLRMILSTVLFLAIALPALSQDPNANLVEAANRVSTYWRGVFAACPARQFPRGALYAEVIAGRMKGSILEIADPSFQFQTDQIDTIAMLNGMEFSASSTLRASAARFFDPKSGWTAWKKAAEFTVNIRRENGKWSSIMSDGVSYTETGGGPETAFRAFNCDRVPNGAIRLLPPNQ